MEKKIFNGKRQFEERNLSMMMDFYEMTMSNGYFLRNDINEVVAFDVFYRRNPDNGGFAIYAGLEQIVDYILNMHFSKEDVDYFRQMNLFDDKFLDYLENFKFTGDVYSFPEGTVMYPSTPIVTIIAPTIDAQLVETAILATFNHESLIATKTRRIVSAAKGRSVSDFGARRAHNMDAAVYGARAAYIAGVNSTATVLAGQMFNIPVSGTMAHSWVMDKDDEYTAFLDYAKTYPNACVLLVDTYNVLESGIPNAIRVAKEYLEPNGYRLKGVRLDSGDLAYLSKETRKMLDAAGCEDCIIIASNSLDEYIIRSLINQGAKIDSFGVGERLITSKSEPVFGGVYKICMAEKDGEFVPKIKVSENIEKMTNPGLKKVWRIYNEEGYAIADLLTIWDEEVDMSKPYRYVDPTKPWKKCYFENCTAKELQVPIIKGGNLVYDLPTVEEIRSYVKEQLENTVWEEEQRFENPHIHYVDMSPALYDLKTRLLNEISEKM